MFVNSGRAIVFMFSGMNKDVNVLGLVFSVYLFFMFILAMDTM